MSLSSAFSWHGLPQYAARLIAEAIRQGGQPCAVVGSRPSVPVCGIEEMGGFDPRWVHFDIFLWTHLNQSYGYAVAAGHWTLTRVHAQQVAVLSRQNQRSYRDFYAVFLPQVRPRYKLGAWAYFKLRLKPLSQASAPLVVALPKRQLGEFFSQWMALPFWSWTLVLILTGLNFFRERQRNAELWKHVPAALTYE